MSIRFMRILRSIGLQLLLLSISGLAVSDDKAITESSPLPANARRVPAYEHILFFDSLARFQPNGSMEMRENITVLAPGKEIRRGFSARCPLAGTDRTAKFLALITPSNRSRAMDSRNPTASIARQKR